MAKKAPPWAALRGRPGWLKFARGYLRGLRRSDKAAYRGIGGRFLENWTGGLEPLAPAFDRIAAGYARELHRRTWRPMGSLDDTALLCALVFECFAWWAAEERGQVGAVRDAAGELLALQDTIDRSIDELCAAVARVEELRLRHGLEVSGPMFVDDLGEALNEAAELFPKWQGPAVQALIEHGRQHLHADRPGVLDLLRAARSVGVLHSRVSHPMRNFVTGEWLRTCEPEIVAADEGAAEALRVSGGSGAAKDAPQLRQLFARLQRMADMHTADPDAPGPLQWLRRRIFPACAACSWAAARRAMAGPDCGARRPKPASSRALCRKPETPSSAIK